MVIPLPLCVQVVGALLTFDEISAVATKGAWPGRTTTGKSSHH